MNIFLWILQILLGLMFLAAGSMKASQSKAKIKEGGGERMAWVDDLSEGQVTTIGVLEVAAGLGLILPMATGILPWLTPLAAIGLILTMIGAAIVHARRGDGAQSIITNVVLLALAAVIVFGRASLFAAM